MKLSELTEQAQMALRKAGATASDMLQPTVRLGVTGLARAGKTVFITALIHNLLAGGRLPFFGPWSEGRIRRAYLEPQPDDAVPRFDYERHVQDLAGDPPTWPESTRQLAQVRLTIEFETRSFLKRQLGQDRLHVDIVDYPGEWLLDLALLNQSFDDWSRTTIDLWDRRQTPGARAWVETIAEVDPSAAAHEGLAARLAAAYREALGDARSDPDAALVVAPGRFLMPGELEGSPALTFSPLPPGDNASAANSLASMMARRYESYKTLVVKPFFRDHLARLDRQIVLVDALSALNRGPQATGELQTTLEQILACFRPGAKSWLSPIVGRRIDRIVFAATKADHLHHESHDRLEAILARLTEGAIARAEREGAEVRVVALAAVRTTREGKMLENGAELPCILGVPLAGQSIGGETFDGETELAIYPGELPVDPGDALAASGPGTRAPGWQFVRFRPPRAELDGSARPKALPHIRLDRALDMLLGDRLT